MNTRAMYKIAMKTDKNFGVSFVNFKILFQNTNPKNNY